jgi:hypothetical protein
MTQHCAGCGSAHRAGECSTSACAQLFYCSVVGLTLINRRTFTLTHPKFSQTSAPRRFLPPTSHIMPALAVWDALC